MKSNTNGMEECKHQQMIVSLDTHFCPACRNWFPFPGKTFDIVLMEEPAYVISIEDVREKLRSCYFKKTGIQALGKGYFHWLEEQICQYRNEQPLKLNNDGI